VPGSLSEAGRARHRGYLSGRFFPARCMPACQAQMQIFVTLKLNKFPTEECVGWKMERRARFAPAVLSR